ncbi:hypothetical protein D3C74_334540 [compost metagenome]
MQHTGDQQHLLLHPLGVGSDAHIVGFFQIKQVHQPFGLGISFGPLHTVQLANECQILPGGQAVIELCNLGHIADPPFVGGIAVSDVPAKNPDRTCVAFHQPQHNFYRSALACPIRANVADNLPPVYFEVYAPQHHPVAVIHP